MDSQRNKILSRIILNQYSKYVHLKILFYWIPLYVVFVNEQQTNFFHGDHVSAQNIIFPCDQKHIIH